MFVYLLWEDGWLFCGGGHVPADLQYVAFSSRKPHTSWFHCFIQSITSESNCWLHRSVRAGSCPSEGFTLGVLRGADSTVALQSHGIVVERRDVGQAAGQPHRHVAGLTVGAHTVVAVNVGGVRHRFLQKSTRTHRNGGYSPLQCYIQFP